MPYQTIEVRKLNPVIGAEVHGVDLSKDIGNQQFREVHDALMENLVIFFRDQTKADENSKHVAGEEWHSDVSCDEEPPMGSILHLHTVPPDGGGDTMFANMYAAFEALSPSLQRLLEGMTAIHDSAKAHRYRVKAVDR